MSRARSGFSRLQEGLTGERSLVGARYMDDPDMLRAYLDYYWPVSREQARRAIAATAFLSRAGIDSPDGKASGSKRADSVLDVGSGPGPVAAAFVEAGASRAALLDQSRRALDLALAEIPKRAARVGVPGSATGAGGSGPGPVTEPALFTLACDITRPDPQAIPGWGSFDRVSFGHSLNELFAGKPDRVALRADLIARYSGALAPGGLVFVIEPALLSTSRELLAVRDELVSRGWRVIAPCAGRETLPCPALAAGTSQTCHEDVAWKVPAQVAALAESRNLDKEYLKMTWFALEPPASDAKGTVRIADAEADDARRSICRVVSEPMLNKGGRLRRLVCGSGGRFPLSVASGSPDRARVGFDGLRRGDFVSVEAPEIRENGWGVGPATAIALREETR